MIKKLFLIILILVIGFILLSRSQIASSITQNYLYASVCTEPIYFKIGEIDPRFGLSEDQVISYSKDAAQIWNSSANKRLFEYNPNGLLTVNMVYDYRQSLNTQIDQLKTDLDNGKTSLDEEIRKFRILSENFEAKDRAFQEKVKKWNKNKNGTEEEYNRLVEEQNELRNDAQKLNLTASQLNIDTNEYNSKISSLNKTIESFTNAIEKRPEEGVYDPNTETINIYFNNDQDELIRTLAHEMGHARGLGHLNDINAIMYPKTTKVLTPTSEEIALIDEICKPFPRYEPYIENFKYNLKMVLANLN